MKSLYDFIVKPLGETYDNTINVDNTKLILNNNVESFKFVNNYAEVISTPLMLETPVNVGDIILVHHNVFRRWYDIKGKQKNGRAFFVDDLYFVSIDQVYLYKNKNGFNPFGDRCFVKPIKSKNVLDNEKEQSLVGILKIGNSSLEALGINQGDLVGFKPNSEFDFLINKERLYCMKSNDIVLKYERKGDEEEYNPSWAESS
jgi:co-chaperonin GroES (HSP10)